MKAEFSQEWGKGAAFLTLECTSDIRDQSPGEGESWGPEPRDEPPFPCRESPGSQVNLRGSGFNVIAEAHTFPSVQCGFCVVHIVGLQDVKCHPRTEPGKEWAEHLFREF